MAAICWHKNIGSGTPSQPQCFDLSHTTLDQLIARMPRDQLPTYNNRGQCMSGSYVQSTTAPYSRAPSTTSYISTQGPVVHDITHIEDNKGDCYNLTSVLSTCDDISYSSYITEHLNKDYVQELPRHYVRHWAITIDASVAPLHFAPDICLETVDYDIKLLTATNTPIKVYGTKTVLLASGKVS